MGLVKMLGGPAGMFPRAPLWLSTGLAVRSKKRTVIYTASVSTFVVNQYIIPDDTHTSTLTG